MPPALFIFALALAPRAAAAEAAAEAAPEAVLNRRYRGAGVLFHTNVKRPTRALARTQGCPRDEETFIPSCTDRVATSLATSTLPYTFKLWGRAHKMPGTIVGPEAARECVLRGSGQSQNVAVAASTPRGRPRERWARRRRGAVASTPRGRPRDDQSRTSCPSGCGTGADGMATATRTTACATGGKAASRAASTQNHIRFTNGCQRPRPGRPPVLNPRARPLVAAASSPRRRLVVAASPPRRRLVVVNVSPRLNLAGGHTLRATWD